MTTEPPPDPDATPDDGPARRAKADPAVLARLRATTLESFERFMQENDVEFACATPRLGRDGVVRAVVLMKASVLAAARVRNDLKVEVIAGPPRTLAEVPQVGKGNRFKERAVLPTGLGKVVRRPR